FNSTTDSNIALGSDNWTIEKDNYIRFGKGKVETNNFELTDGERQVFIESYGESGLSLALNNMDFGFLNEVWVFPKLDFQGRFNFNITAEDVFKLNDLTVRATMDSLFINDDYFGRVGLKADAETIRSKAKARLEIAKGDMQLKLAGTYNLPNFQSESTADSERANYLDFDLDVQQYPVDILEYFIGDAISNTVGKFDIDAQFFGQPKQPNSTGKLRLYETAVTLDYLNLRMFVNDDTATIDNFMVNATGGIIRDRAGNEAYVMGGLTHTHLKKWGFNATVTTEKFIGLDTQKGDNSIYYGKAIGQGTVQFTGTFQRPNIEADVTAGRGSKLFIPLSSTNETGEVSFIRFVDKDKPKDDLEEKRTAGFFSELKGLSFRMDLTITDEASAEMIFDEQAGDIIKGRGNGNIQIVVPRGGELSMYGDFEIAEGEYLFTLLNFINKPFVVREGGTIRWNGDPYNAQINLVAEYKNLSTPIANFIQEYLQSADPNIQRAANRPTSVDLGMNLSGDLLKPNINFNIIFPDLNGQLSSYVETKMRTLVADQNELNRQVFGLIVLGQFLPSDFNFAAGDLAFNTITEMLSSQLSILATELLSDVLVDGNIIRSVDFDFAYSRYDGTTSIDQFSTFGNEVQAQIRSNIFNDKLSVVVGGNVDLQNGSNSSGGVLPGNGAFFGNDFIIEYILNENRTLKLRLYQRLDQDFATGTELQFGTGLSYRQEFDTFKELFGNWLKKK
ncbi:MAG: translocation/assembly module TamB domain-containing protein, partial [Saprospiraceae bacterium]